VPDEIHQIGGIFSIVNCEGSIQPNRLGILAQEPRTNSVEGSGVGDRMSHCCRPLAHHIRHYALNASGHLPGGAPGEGQ
jgi:hypothetical protein